MLPAPETHANAVIARLRELFAQHGIPDILHIDNELQYASAAFTEFARL